MLKLVESTKIIAKNRFLRHILFQFKKMFGLVDFEFGGELGSIDYVSVLFCQLENVTILITFGKTIIKQKH